MNWQASGNVIKSADVLTLRLERHDSKVQVSELQGPNVKRQILLLHLYEYLADHTRTDRRSQTNVASG